MMDLYVSQVEVHFILISCNILISHCISSVNYIMTFIILYTMLQLLDFQTSHFNISYQAFSLIMTQWKAQFKEIYQWKNFKISLLMLLEKNLKIVDLSCSSYIITIYNLLSSICLFNNKFSLLIENSS